MKKVLFVAGARPNFPKIAPLMRAFKGMDSVVTKLVHTGQHYDKVMSDSFFSTLEIPEPDVNFDVRGGSHAQQTAKIMIAFEDYVLDEKPDIVVVVGDVNSTLACGLVAKKCHIPLAHVEAGLRSFDNSMPEEINRILVDRISDLMFVTEQSGLDNLKNEGVDDSKVHFVGNVMIDSLVFALPKIRESNTFSKYNLEKGSYGLITMHRPATVDFKDKLEKYLDFLLETKLDKLVWPIHPRTKNNISKFELEDKLNSIPNLIILEPLEYVDFMNLVINSKVVLTDSGGIQEETSFLDIPCLTFRENTERPVTADIGSNVMVGRNYDLALKVLADLDSGSFKKAEKIPLWDGDAAKRIAKLILDYLEIKD
ncbi:UDP-N-acetylglucosamine 2-epimerase (non-hydrolyzing) [Candidatus Woesearchaeota archaeon]|nr:UDP-N-acetylglucosamine 2-epimerase (non-hydrolyzing) [Candidatus Woesearchaeota archaeon]